MNPERCQCKENNGLISGHSRYSLGNPRSSPLSDPRTWELAAPSIDATSSLCLPHSTNVWQSSEKEAMSWWGLWWGPPAPTFWDHCLHSDNGTEYNNNLVKELAGTFAIHHSFTSLYHPQANPVERTNRVLKTMIRSFIGDTTIHATPVFLNMGREPPPRKSIRCLGEGQNELPPADAGYWATRMSKL